MKKLLITGVAVALAAGIGIAEAGDAERMPKGAKDVIHQKHPGGSGQAAAVTAGEIAKNPSSFYGKKVRVSAEVEDVYSAHAFTLDEDAAFAGPDVLVLNPAPSRASKDDEQVTVTGTIRQYVESDIKRDYQWFDPRWLAEAAGIGVDFTTRPVLVSDSVRAADGSELVKSGDATLSAGDQPLGADKKLEPMAPQDMHDKHPDVQ
jgi:hypothetical protein